MGTSNINVLCFLKELHKYLFCEYSSATKTYIHKFRKSAIRVEFDSSKYKIYLEILNL